MMTVSAKPAVSLKSEIAEQAKRRDKGDEPLKQRQSREQETDRDDAEQGDGDHAP